MYEPLRGKVTTFPKQVPEVYPVVTLEITVNSDPGLVDNLSQR